MCNKRSFFKIPQTPRSLYIYQNFHTWKCSSIVEKIKNFWKNIKFKRFHDNHNNTETLPEAVFLVVCDPYMNEL